jgi:hypothetical protein
MPAGLIVISARSASPRLRLQSKWLRVTAGQKNIKSGAKTWQCGNQRKPQHLGFCACKTPPRQIYNGPERRYYRHKQYTYKYYQIQCVIGHPATPRHPVRSWTVCSRPGPTGGKLFHSVRMYKLSRLAPQVRNQCWNRYAGLGMSITPPTPFDC